MDSTPNWSADQPPDPSQYTTPAPGYGQPAGGPQPDALAGFWIRFAGALIDGILLGVVGQVLATILGNAGNLLGIAVGGAYFTYFHASAAGQTIGNKVCNIRIVDEANGQSIDYGRAAIRWLMSYVSALAILLGYLWMLWDPNKQTWHDKVARTLVVKTQYYPPAAEFGKPSA